MTKAQTKAQEQEVNKRIQYSYDDEASSLTVKTSLLNLLSIVKGSEKDAKKFCEETAIASKESGVVVGGVSHAVFVKGFKEILHDDIKKQMTDEDFNGNVNERIQYSYEQEPSSMTIKTCLFKALSVKFGDDKSAKQFCQQAAKEAKNSDTNVGRVSNFVFDKAMQAVQKPL